MPQCPQLSRQNTTTRSNPQKAFQSLSNATPPLSVLVVVAYHRVYQPSYSTHCCSNKFPSTSTGFALPLSVSVCLSWLQHSAFPKMLPSWSRRTWIYVGAAVLSVIVVLSVVIPLSVSSGASAQISSGSSVLSEVPLIDGHNDLPYNLYSISSNKLENLNLNSDLLADKNWTRNNTHTDIPHLRAGKVGGQFWVAYVSCTKSVKDAVEKTMEQIDVIKRMIAGYPDHFQYATTADGGIQWCSS